MIKHNQLKKLYIPRIKITTSSTQGRIINLYNTLLPTKTDKSSI